ncbi:MAG: response regulator transcription factor [Armatimonadota bacterium]
MPNGNVLVIAADNEVGEHLDRALTGRGFTTSLARIGTEAITLARSTNPVVIVIDCDSLRSQAIPLCTELRAFLTRPVIIVNGIEHDSDIVLTLAVGADMVLIKPLSVSVLIAHVDAAIRRETVYRRRAAESELLAVRDLTVDLAGCELRRSGKTVPLSPMEFRLLRVLVENAGRVLTRDQLLNSVWDVRGDQVYSRTVDVHIGRLRKKIEDDPTRQKYIVTVPGVGYKLRTDGHA